MKIIFVSDTHGKHEQLINLPEADMIIHAGDISTHGLISQIDSFVDWFSALPYKYKIFIAGNHDFGLQQPNGKMMSKVIEYLEGKDVIYLQDNYVDIEGIRIYGTPWTPKFYNWAFMKDRGVPIATEWAKIPYGTDILISHGPPAGFGDRCVSGDIVGCEDLLSRILEIKPKLVIFGHIHEGRNVYKMNEFTYAINASVLNENYSLVNLPITVDYTNNEIKDILCL